MPSTAVILFSILPAGGNVSRTGSHSRKHFHRKGDEGRCYNHLSLKKAPFPVSPQTPRHPSVESSCVVPVYFLVHKYRHAHLAKREKTMTAVAEGPDNSSCEMLQEQQEVQYKRGKRHFLGSAEKSSSNGGLSQELPM